MLQQQRPLWIRGLRLYDVSQCTSLDDAWPALGGSDAVDQVHARSRFRSLTDPDRIAVYSRQGAPQEERDRSAWIARGEHTLAVVREFRRVPLRASALALMLFTARPGNAASAVAALAHFAERAVSHYQPSYLLLARSLETPTLIALLTGVEQCAALQAGASSFSVDGLMPELAPMLESAPELFAYCPERSLDVSVSPTAV